MPTGTRHVREHNHSATVAKQAAYVGLKEAIVGAALKPGSPLPERGLAERYRLSRTPVREILQRLHHEGLVELVPHRGAFVRQIRAEQLVDIFYAREAVEGMAARLAATRHDEAQLPPIARTFKHLRIEDRPAALARMVDAGRRLHDFVVEGSGNTLLQRAYEALTNQAMLIRSITRDMFEIEKASYRDHLNILDAVRRRDADAAEQAMRHHLASTRMRVFKQVFKEP